MLMSHRQACMAGICAVAWCWACVTLAAPPPQHYRDGSDTGTGLNASHQARAQLTHLKLSHFSHRGSLHVDRIELRSEDNGRNAFYVHNPTDPRYPLWAAARASVNSVWPKPTEESRRSQRIFHFLDTFSIKFAGAKDDIMSEAAQRYSMHLFKSVTAVSDVKIPFTLGGIGELRISVRNANFKKYPHLDMREDYELDISATGVTLVAEENWGVVRGLETLSQLIFVSRNQPNKFFIQENRIRDKPTYQHRGLMIDTARHFVRKSTLLENLEAMAINKMNVFHWHIVDDQSFPFMGKRFPNLAEKSAYAGSTYFYTTEDIREIVEFARLRGIRVIPEFDSPDHTHSWGHGMPNIMSWCKFDGMAYMGPLDPTNEATFGFLKEFFGEVAELFPDSYMHLGMDEVSTDCWRLNTSFDQFMTKNGMRNHEQLIVYYANRLAEIIANLPQKKKIVVWEDILSKDTPEMPLRLPPDTIVQVWITRDPIRVAEWAKKYKVLHSEEWYLDHQVYGSDWVKRYRYSMGDRLGGEACMWTEYQSDQTVTPHTWPSVSAVAERLWSGPTVTDAIQAAPRIEEQNCRMQARGIRIGVAGGPGMCQTPVFHYRPPWWKPDPDGDSADLPVNQVVNFSSGQSLCWLYVLLCALVAAGLACKCLEWRWAGLRSNSAAGMFSFCRTALTRQATASLIYVFLVVYVIFWLLAVWIRD